MCDQCGAPILILNEALSYEGNDQKGLQAFWMSIQSAGIFLIKMNRRFLKRTVAVKSWKKHIITGRHIGLCDLWEANPYWVSFVAVHAKKNGFGKEKPII